MDQKSRSAAIKGLCALGAVTAALAPIYGAPASNGGPLSRLTIGKPESLGRPIASVAVVSAQVTEEDGRPILLAVAGTSGVTTLNVVDIRSNKLLRAFPLTKGSGGAWGGTVMPDGTVYLLTQRLYRYDPRRKQVEDLGVPLPGETAFFALDQDEKGNLYGGSYPNGQVFRYDPRANRFEALGDSGQPYARSTVYHSGTVYAGTSPTGKIIALDVKTGAKREIPIAPAAAGEPNQVYGLNVRGDRYLFAFVTYRDKSSTLRVYDLKDQKWWDEEFPGYKDTHVGPEQDGKVYFRWKNHWHELDLTTRKARELPAVAGSPYRSGGWARVGAADSRAIVSVNFDGGLVLVDPRTGEQKTLPGVMQSDPAGIQAMAAGPDGRLYLSGYLASRAAVLDTGTGKATLFPMGQGEGIVAHGNKVWWGVYSGAFIHEMDTDKPLVANRNPREVYHIPDEQDRPFGVAASDGWAVFGTVPTYGRVGGSLTVQDRRTGKWQSHRNVVQDQSIVSLALKGDIVYGSTSIFGGLGGDPKATEAKVFAWDLRSGRKITESGVRFGDKKPPAFIGRIALGPDGLIWGVAAGTVFALDPQTLALKRHRVLFADAGEAGRWRPPFVGFGPDGLLYTNLDNRVTVVDPTTLDFRPLGIAADLMTLGSDGHIYYRPSNDVAGVMRVRVKRN